MQQQKIHFVYFFMGAFCDRIRLARKGENQATFAARFGLKVAVYSHYETGRREPSLDTVVLMATILNVSTDWLLGKDSEPQLNSIQAGDGSAVAIGGNASVVNGTPSTPGELAACRKCPYRKKLEKLEALLST